MTLVNEISRKVINQNGGLLGAAGIKIIQSKDNGVIRKTLTTSSAGWYLGYNRTIYVAGGPSASSVRISGLKQNIIVEDFAVDPINITADMPIGFIVKEYIDNGKVVG